MSALSAVQDCLAAEHAALFGYGVVGGRLNALLAATAPEQAGRASADVAAAAAAYAEHRARRDRLAELLESADARPVAALPVYRTPDPSSAAECRRLARRLENRCAAVYGLAVSRTEGSTRRLLASALIACARREVGWGAPVEAFPGLPEF